MKKILLLIVILILVPFGFSLSNLLNDAMYEIQSGYTTRILNMSYPNNRGIVNAHRQLGPNNECFYVIMLEPGTKFLSTLAPTEIPVIGNLVVSNIILNGHPVVTLKFPPEFCGPPPPPGATVKDSTTGEWETAGVGAPYSNLPQKFVDSNPAGFQIGNWGLVILLFVVAILILGGLVILRVRA